MTWLKYHSKSEEYASQAEVAFRRGDLSLSTKYYQLAAKEEEIALSKLDPSKKRTLGITAVSAASLWFKGGDFKKTESTVYKCLSSYSLPPFAIAQLRTILKTIWDEESWINKINLYSQIVDVDEEQELVRLNCKFDKDSVDTFEKIFPLNYFKNRDKLLVETPILVQIFQREGEVQFLFTDGEEDYFEDEEYIDISDLEDSSIFKPIAVDYGPIN